MTSRTRSRSREKIISMAVAAEIHRLPQDQRRSMQSLRQTISDGAQLAQVGCMIRALRSTAEGRFYRCLCAARGAQRSSKQDSGAGPGHHVGHSSNHAEGRPADL